MSRMYGVRAQEPRVATNSETGDGEPNSETGMLTEEKARPTVKRVGNADNPATESSVAQGA